MLELNSDSIQDLGGGRFFMQSATISSQVYLVHLGNKTCDCPDWPRVNLCKHVAAVAHFFGSGAQQLIEAEDVTAKAPSPPQEDSPATEDGSCNDLLVENLIVVSQEFLGEGVPKDQETTRNLQMLEAHLTAVVHSSRSSESPILEKEVLPPNPCEWTKTTDCMGTTQWKRRK